MPRKARLALRIDDEGRIRFWDHMEGGKTGAPVESYVYGRIIEVTDARVILESWTTVDPDDPDRDDRDNARNVTKVGIVRSCITDFTPLRKDRKRAKPSREDHPEV